VSPSPIVLTVRARRALARPAVRRLCVSALAAATCLTVVSLLGAVDDARDRWGRTHPVAVATRDLSPGDVVEPGSFEVRDLPEGVLPEGALGGAAAEPPVGSVVRHPVLTGEPLVAARLAPDGLTGAAALVPPGWRAVAVPVGPAGAPPLAVGDHVDVLAVMPAGLDVPVPAGSGPDGPDGVGPDDAGTDEAGTDGTGREPAFALVEGAAVVDVADDAVTVAVPAGDAPRVAWALSNGGVVLALGGG